MTQSTRFALAVVVDDDDDIGLAARLALRDLFDEVLALDRPDRLPALIAERAPDVLLLDLNFARGATDGREGFEWLDRVVSTDPDLAVVIITAHGGVSIAVEAIKRGATDFIMKPWANDRLAATVRSAAALTRSRREARLEHGRNREISPSTLASPLLGNSPAMARVHSLIARAGPTDANVLILGENGTGKELVARALHAYSRRAEKPLVTVDLGVVSETLFDSELFGHVKGAFTDARSDRIGRMKAADGSTLFLDEIGNLPLHLQPKLLTALEQRQVTPVGSNRAMPIDVRIVAATNCNRDVLADEARFRQDLLFRLNTVEIELPPLRERREDIPLLLTHYLDLYARKYGKPSRPVRDAALDRLTEHDWPGNVRALRHAAERAIILAEGDVLEAEDFPMPNTVARVQVARSTAPDLNLDRQERQAVEAALKRHNFNISLAATELGLSRGALYRRMEKHGL
ncbi:sigma-54 dependent transcriptional regulator [Sphingomonas sp. 1P06PA]|uniref:sigma-54-dependent transcriptional regulator n=1 Tax=Sphingomonas sp. 1P06PA TaxID=554121 RepID=UPI0039A453B7